MKLVPIVAVLALFVFVPAMVGEVFGHGLGGDVAPPISFQGKDVTVSTMLEPSDLTVGEVDNAIISVRFFDAAADENISEVTYRVEVWRGGELLARNQFYDKNGDLSVDVRPLFDCDADKLWQCSKYFGEKHPIAGAYYTYGESNPRIQGPIFDKGGLYNIRVDILGAESPRTQLADPLSFETFVSVAQEQNFVIQTAQAEEVPVVVKTYYDDIEELNYDSTDNSISFEMPFNWQPDYIDQVQLVHEEVRVPKDFDPYSEGKQFKGYVDGIEVENRVLILDPYSFEDQNILHFLVTGKELKRINDALGSDHHDNKNITFELVPQSEVQENSLEFDLDGEKTATVRVAWDTAFGAGDNVPFEITFFDENRNLLKDVRYAYTLTDENGNEVAKELGSDPQNPGIVSSEGIDIQRIEVPSSGRYTMDVALLGQGIDYKKTYSGIGSGLFEIGKGSGVGSSTDSSDAIEIPNWVRNNAKWWADGEITDDDFATGIEFMIKQEIIIVPPTEAKEDASAVIPDWVRNNAKWWADGEITDKDFASGLQFMVANGIISV